MSELVAIILAAGKGTRMKSDLAKVLHPLAGLPMLDWSLNLARNCGVTKLVTVVGHQAETVSSYCSSYPDVIPVVQKEQLGTGHAVATARFALEKYNGTVLILCGDTPLLTKETVKSLLETHRKEGAVLSVLTTTMPDPTGYGRIVRGVDGAVLRIVEQKDATEKEREIREINSGIYCMEADFLRDNIDSIGNKNVQGEFYLTDLVAIAVKKGLLCTPFCSNDPDEIMGVNDRIQLSAAGEILRKRINRNLMLSGVTLVDPSTTYIDAGVVIGNDTTIAPNCHISGSTKIGNNCVIETGVLINSCTVGERSHIKSGSVLEGSTIYNDVAIGPMAHLRPGTVLNDSVKIGNFVETKKIVMGKGSKASHLTYLGDAEIGSDVNIGCGTITCNYDGVKKHKTVIGDGVFIGSDVQLVAPVSVGRNSLVAAGTTVTVDVPPDSLALSRVPQLNKEGWRLRKKGE